MLKTAPCKDCQDRQVGCHSQCEKYQEYDRQQQWLRQQRYKENAIISYKDRKYYAELKRKGRMKQ